MFRQHAGNILPQQYSYQCCSQNVQCVDKQSSVRIQIAFVPAFSPKLSKCVEYLRTQTISLSATDSTSSTRCSAACPVWSIVATTALGLLHLTQAGSRRRQRWKNTGLQAGKVNCSHLCNYCRSIT